MRPKQKCMLLLQPLFGMSYYFAKTPFVPLSIFERQPTI